MAARGPGENGMKTAVAFCSRHTTIDAVRGIAMIVMALDHVRDFMHADAMAFAPGDLSRTSVATFFTRWITHFCAPAFLFIAGLSAQRRLANQGAAGGVALFLATRGLWLILLELTVFRFILDFRLFGGDPLLVLVLSALGLCMLVLAPLVAVLSARAIGAIGLVIILLHNLLDPLQAAHWGALAPLWLLLHQPGAFDVAGQVVVVGYPMLPWFGVLAVGFAAGALYDASAAKRRQVLVAAGVLSLVAFVVLRAANAYGDPVPWSVQATPAFTALSFLGTTKYPPSLLFLLMTLGPVLLGLAWFERYPLSAGHPLAVIGRVPLFYYLAHFLLAHLVASCLAVARYHDVGMAFFSGPLPSLGGSREAFPQDMGWPLGVVYLAWCAVVLALYPACVWFDRFKRRHRNAWWSGYL